MSSKRFKKLPTKTSELNPESIDKLLPLVKKNCTTKFDESIDLNLQINNKQKKGDFIARTSVSVAFVKGTDFWLISNDAGDSLIGLEGMVEFFNLISGESIDITSGKSGISTSDGSVQTFKTDPKTIPEDPSDTDSGTQKLEIELKDATGKKKTLIIEYN